MNNDEPPYTKKLQKFSVVKKCPRCNQLSLSYLNNKLSCSECGYEEMIPMVK